MEMAKLIADMVCGFGTFVVAAMVGIITYRQFCTSRDKLRLDLFEKRYAVYGILMNFLANIIGRSRLEAHDIMAFRAKTSDATFFFDSELCQYLVDVYEKAWEFRLANQKLFEHNPADAQERSQLADHERTLMLWFDKQIRTAQQTFEPYLKFDVKREDLLTQLWTRIWKASGCV